MATDATQARASRRSAAAAARNAPVVMPDALADVLEHAAESPVDEAEGSSNADPGSQGGSLAQSANLSALRAAGKLITRQTNDRSRSLALPQVDLTRQIDTGDLIMPKIRISQAMSQVNTIYAQSRGKEGVVQGNWYHTTTGKDLGETLYFVPVDMRKSRSMFEQGRGLVCRSFDMLVGEGDPGIMCEGTIEEINTVPEDERGCALRLWNRDGDRNIPPKCGVTYNYVGFAITDIENPEKSQLLQGMLQFRSTAVAAARALNTAVMNFGEGIWHNVVVEIASNPKTNTRGTFFVPGVEFLCGTDAPGFESVARKAASLARSVGKADLRASIETDPES
jgi:hypothetical protein